MKTKAVPAVVAGVIVVASVTGCGGGAPVPEPGAASSAAKSSGDAPVADAGAEAPQAFVFESGVLEIGDFDPFTLGDDIFDPCTEITPEEFAAAGFDRVEPLPEDLQGLARGLSVCEVFRPDGTTNAHFSNSKVNRQTLEEKAEILEEPNSIHLPAAYVFVPKDLGGGCFAQVDTKRGGIVAGVVEEMDGDHTQACTTALSMLEQLHSNHSS